MAIVVFDAGEFREQYPQWAALSDARLGAAFDTACLVLANTEGGPAPYNPDRGVFIRKTLLYLLMCHMLTLDERGGSLVGVISSATEGSVSTGFSLPQKLSDAGWYAQTQCGLTFYQAAKAYFLGGRHFAYCKCDGPIRGRYFSRR